jgi:hypothetical protein
MSTMCSFMASDLPGERRASRPRGVNDSPFSRSELVVEPFGRAAALAVDARHIFGCNIERLRNDPSERRLAAGSARRRKSAVVDVQRDYALQMANPAWLTQVLPRVT